MLGGGGTFGLYWWASPYHTDVGYKPTQPIEYSHKLHAGDLGVDCRYCHAYVERSAFAGVPPTATCMNCHAQVKKDSEKLEKLRASWADGKGDKSVEWVRIHKLPDFAFFNHSAHMGVGVGENRAAIGCETCHGRIDTMDVVKQVQPLSMSWCLECHSNPAPNLRPVAEITAMGWSSSSHRPPRPPHPQGRRGPPRGVGRRPAVAPAAAAHRPALAGAGRGVAPPCRPRRRPARWRCARPTEFRLAHHLAALANPGLGVLHSAVRGVPLLDRPRGFSGCSSSSFQKLIDDTIATVRKEVGA